MRHFSCTSTAMLLVMFALLWSLTLVSSEEPAAEACASMKSRYLIPDYSGVLARKRDKGVKFDDLPGFTRSVFERDHALITPESRVWAGMPGWKNAVTAHFISKALGANFAMYLAKVDQFGTIADPPAGVERFVLVLDGSIQVTSSKPELLLDLTANHYIYFPPNITTITTSMHGAQLLVYERVYAIPFSFPQVHHGFVDDSPLVPTAGEVFVLRKLLPASGIYDFNIHVMDFQPGEHLNVKEIHYNQHGLLLLQGKGIYRLGDKWYPVQAGDVVWMAPYVVQWYAALGYQPTRYIIYKDTSVNPLYDP